MSDLHGITVPHKAVPAGNLHKDGSAEHAAAVVGLLRSIRAEAAVWASHI
jgi:hypothetical protein